MVSYSLLKRCKLKMRMDKTRGDFDIKYGIGLALFLIIVAAVVPTAFTQIVRGCSTLWDTPTQLLWGLIPVGGVVAILLYIFR